MDDVILRQRLERSDLGARTLSRISGQVAAGANLDEAYRGIVNEIKVLVDFHRFTVFLFDRKSGLTENPAR